MNHDPSSLESSALGASSSALPLSSTEPARDPYETPTLTDFGRFEHVTTASPAALQGPNPDEILAAGGDSG